MGKGCLRISDLGEGDRPRERLARLGAQALSNAELVAILLRTGTSGASALDLARRLLALGKDEGVSGPGGPVNGLGDPGLRRLATASLEELGRVPGVGPAKAVALKAALELGRRVANATTVRRAVRSPEDVSNLVMEDMRYLDREQFRIVLLDSKNHVLGVRTVSVGSLSASIVHPREIFKEAIARSSAAIILVHNHPSGDPTPSREDVEVTRRLVEAGKLLGIEVLDHVVVGDNRYVSLKEKGIC
ncbi:MAG: DNA repair protein RadC [Firmicutes bacterium]|nr:DNA repair protein RadC [Bacillota bacterium]